MTGRTAPHVIGVLMRGEYRTPSRTVAACVTRAIRKSPTAARARKNATPPTHTTISVSVAQGKARAASDHMTVVLNGAVDVAIDSENADGLSHSAVGSRAIAQTTASHSRRLRSDDAPPSTA